MKKQRVFLILLFSLFLAVSIFSGTVLAKGSKTRSARKIPGWTMTFNDEFKSGTLDKSKYVRYWGKPSTGGAVSWWNGDSALIVQDGYCASNCQRKRNQRWNSVSLHCWGFTQLTAQTYGRWVVRARMPQGAGTQGYISLWRTGL
jgi:hypothetical protein